MRVNRPVPSERVDSLIYLPADAPVIVRLDVVPHLSDKPSKQPRMVGSTLRIYSVGLIFVSARTNKRHHRHHQRVNRLKISVWIISLGVRGSPPLDRVDRLPRIAWIASLEAIKSTILKRVDHLPSSALIASLGARGSPPSERVDVPCVELMGSLEHSPAARSCGCTQMRANALQTTTKRAFVPLLRVCVFITAVPIIKLFAWGEGDSGGHLLRETTSRGLCGLVCPSRNSDACLKNPKLFSAFWPLVQIDRFDLQGANRISSFQSRIFVKKRIRVFALPLSLLSLLLRNYGPRLEILSYLEDQAGSRSLVFDLFMTHHRFGSSTHVHQNGLLSQH